MQEEKPLEVTVFWRRFAAFLIDFLLAILLLVLLMVPVVLAAQNGSSSTWIALLVALLWLGMVLAYDTVLTKLLGGTLGKKALKLKVVDLGQNPLSWGRSAARSLSRALHMVTFNFISQFLLEDKMIEKLKIVQDPLQLASHGPNSIWFSIVLLWILSVVLLYTGYYLYFFTKNRQALHDLMAGTLVVRKH